VYQEITPTPQKELPIRRKYYYQMIKKITHPQTQEVACRTWSTNYQTDKKSITEKLMLKNKNTDKDK